jgi:hypothetical protein
MFSIFPNGRMAAREMLSSRPTPVDGGSGERIVRQEMSDFFGFAASGR